MISIILINLRLKIILRFIKRISEHPENRRLIYNLLTIQIIDDFHYPSQGL